MPTFELLGVTVDPIAIILAAVAYMVVGMLWYGPIFGKQWATLTHIDITEARMSVREIGSAFGVAILLATGLNSILQFAQQVSELEPVTNVLISSGMIAFTTTLAVFGEEFIWEGRNIRLLLINWGHQFVNYIVMGTVLALFIL